MASEKMKARAEDIDLEGEELGFEIDADGEQYISQEDIIEEITLDGEAPMEEDDGDEAADILPEPGQSSPYRTPPWLNSALTVPLSFPFLVTQHNHLLSLAAKMI